MSLAALAGQIAYIFNLANSLMNPNIPYSADTGWKLMATGLYVTASVASLFIIGHLHLEWDPRPENEGRPKLVLLLTNGIGYALLVSFVLCVKGL